MRGKKSVCERESILPSAQVKQPHVQFNPHDHQKRQNQSIILLLVTTCSSIALPDSLLSISLAHVLTIPLHSTIPPSTHAGHHTHQTTKLVHTPCATQPLATSSRIAFKPFPENHASAKSAEGGETIR